MPLQRYRYMLFLASVLILAIPAARAQDRSWDCAVYPNESHAAADPVTGASLLFVTTNESEDENLYFHQRSWIADESVLIFTSNRTGKTEPFGYIEETGELVRLSSEDENATSGFTAGKVENSLFLWKADGIYEWAIDLSFVTDEDGKHARVKVNERKICDFSGDYVAEGNLTENADATMLSVVLKHRERNERQVAFVNKSDGEIIILWTLEYEIHHLQSSWETPDLVMFCRSGYEGGDRVPMMTDEQYAMQEPHARTWFSSIASPTPEVLHWQRPGELATHECWWVDDQLTFCGGFVQEESHVKVADYRTKEIRILGVGAWWQDATPEALAKRNWWHAAGSPDGRWVAADNWYGDIMLFNGKTTQARPLTLGHRIYGRGAHPHVGWGPGSNRVVFTSNRRDGITVGDPVVDDDEVRDDEKETENADVCVAYLK